MIRYALDTNVFLRAARDAVAGAAFEAFADRAFDRCDFLAPVWLELQAGVRDEEDQAVVDDLVGPFADAARLYAPTAAGWRAAGGVLQALAAHEGLELDRAPASLHHDALIAVTARERGCTLITENVGDFARIRRHLRGFRFTTPYP